MGLRGAGKGGGTGLARWREEAGAAVDAGALAEGLRDGEAPELFAELGALSNPKGSDELEEGAGVASVYQ